MLVNIDDAEILSAFFFDLVDAHYGTSVHHIGDGDGISAINADLMRKLYDKYANAYFSEANNFMVEIADT